MLVKFIDAARDLSVQVHPSDYYALRDYNSYGKTELWHVAEADEGAGIYLGFNRNVTAKECERAIKDKTLTSLLRFYPVKKGEHYFVPAGTVHAICAGYGWRSRSGIENVFCVDRRNAGKGKNQSSWKGSYGVFRLCSKDKRSILARTKDALTSVGANFFEKIHKKVFQCQIIGTENLK